MKRRKLPSITELAQHLRAFSANAGAPAWFTLLWFADGSWDVSHLAPSWYGYDIRHRGMVALVVNVPYPLNRSRDLARDTRDALKEAYGKDKE